MNSPTKIFIIAGEASGDMLGGGLVAALRELRNDFEICGIGGEHLREQGVNSLFPIEDIALMGFAEIVPHTWRLLNRLRQTCEAIAQFNPDIIITIDSPGFNLRIASWVRKAYGKKIRCIHYVAPTVWAYKPLRAAKFAKLFDHLLCILPFEPPYFTAYRLPATFVGHHIADNLAQPPYFNAWQEGSPLELVIFPGSRAGEVAQMLPILMQATELLKKYFAKINLYVATNELSNPHVKLENWAKLAPKIVTNKTELNAIMSRAHLAISKTGTVTLEIAAHNVPMVACYKVNKISAFMVRKLLNIPFVNLLNIINRNMIIPELLQENCTPSQICHYATSIVKNPIIAQQQTQANLHALAQLQNPNGEPASMAAAKIIASYF